MSRSNVIDVSEVDDVAGGGLLSAGDPHPVELCHFASLSPVLLLCEHAGQAVPGTLNGLGLPQGAIDLHVGWDIGAEALARGIAARLHCPLILQRYSRLVMDCNRPPGSVESVPEVSDGVRVPGNAGLSGKDHARRRQAIFDPMEDAISAGFAAHPRRAAFAIHSFTPHFRGEDRPWDAGFLSRRDEATAQTLMEAISGRAPEHTLALNEPYQIDDTTDWFIPRHAEPRGIRHTLIEVRNDHLRTDAGIARWADLLAHAIESVLEINP